MGFESEVKLSDFDAAKAAGLISQNESKQLSGTPGYISPEQGDYEVTYQRQGIFSNGVVVADLLLSKNMFAGSVVSESCQKIIGLPTPQRITGGQGSGLSQAEAHHGLGIWFSV